MLCIQCRTSGNRVLAEPDLPVCFQHLADLLPCCFHIFFLVLLHYTCTEMSWHSEARIEIQFVQPVITIVDPATCAVFENTFNSCMPPAINRRCDQRVCINVIIYG